MTAKEKVIELVDKFTLYLGTDVNGDECYVDIIEAKICALICLDEILEFAYDVEWEKKEEAVSKLKFLKEVKQEINNYDTKRKSKRVVR